MRNIDCHRTTMPFKPSILMVGQMTQGLEQFDPQITQAVLTIDTATRFLEDDQSFKKATALLILGIRWKRVVAKRRAAKEAALILALP
jgi:hypothetical protein